MPSLRFQTPLGEMLALSEADRLTWLGFVDGSRTPDASERGSCLVLELCRDEVTEYLAGHRRTFSVPIAPEGTPFQQRVWAQLLTVQYGQTTSYAAVAKAIGSVARAVGAANGANPVSLIVPCHRVIGADGSLTGYAGGLHRKQRLLAMENPQMSIFSE